MDRYKNSIRDYYETSQWLYKLLWYKPHTMGMHFGLWGKETKKKQEAILRENQLIIDLAKIKKGMKVLDAGCGVGGTAIYISQKTGAKVTGISLSPTQVKMAKQYSTTAGTKELTKFQLMDYCKTKFKKNSFDVVYGIESICYASPKSDFLSEAYRILKPGGKLIIADGYLKRQPKNKLESKIRQDFEKAFCLKKMSRWVEIVADISKVGFVKTKNWDKTKEVTASVDSLYQMAKLLHPVVVVLGVFRNRWFRAIKRNYIAAVTAKMAVSMGLFGYYIQRAAKPELGY